MSRNDSRRGSRERGWNNRERSERNGKNNRSERDQRNDYSESRGKSGFRNERNPRNDRNEYANRRGFDGRNSDRRGNRSESKRAPVNQITQKEIREQENAIKEFKNRVPVCELCGQPITDIASAISNKNDGNPVHFDCVLKKITETEKPGPNEKVAYIGQGKFAVIYYENPRDAKHFSIRKTIEWEGRDQERGEWRNEMAGLYSQVK